MTPMPTLARTRLLLVLGLLLSSVIWSTLSAGDAEQEVRDHCNRDDPQFTALHDPVADAALSVRISRLPQQLQDPLWQKWCRLPTFGTQPVHGRGVRHLDKYDHVFIAAAWFWVGEVEGPGHVEEIGAIAHVMKSISWFESQVGYRSGFTNRRRDGALLFPLQPEGFVDTEDVLQVGNPADLPIHEKVHEMTHLHFHHAQDMVRLVPQTYTHRNITGAQSIFYGTGWYGYKYVASVRAVREAIRRYNGNKTIDAWNGQEHRDNYADSVLLLHGSGVARSPASGQEFRLVQP